MNKECISTRQFDISFSGNVLVTRLEEIDYLFIYYSTAPKTVKFTRQNAPKLQKLMSNTGLTRKAKKYNHSLWVGTIIIVLIGSVSKKNVAIETFRQAGLRLWFNVNLK